MSPVFGLLALVCHWWKTSGWRLPPFPPSLHRSLGCVYGSASPLSLPCVCGARRCCCRRRLLPLPPICICCRALANTHLCSVLFFPLSFCFCHHNCHFLPIFFLFSSLADKGVRAHLQPWSLRGKMGHWLFVTLEYWGRRWTGGERRMG